MATRDRGQDDAPRAETPRPAPARPLDVEAPGWLLRLVEVFLDAHDVAASERAVMQVIAEEPDAPREELAARIAERRLRGIGLRPGGPDLAPPLRARLEPLLPPPGPDGSLAARERAVAVAAVLAARWGVLVDIALLYENRSGRVERALEVFTVTALLLRDLPLARRLHTAHLQAAAGAAVELAPHARAVERLLVARGIHGARVVGGGGGGTIAAGLAYLETRTFAALAAHYFERAAIEEEGVARLNALSATQKVGLVELLIALAWADGRVTPEERRLVEQQVALADLTPADGKRLRALLDRRPALEDLELGPMSKGARRFFLEQAVLLTLVDDDLSAEEQRLLGDVARRLGGTPEELEATIIEVAAYYEKNRDAVHDLGPVSGAFGRLRTLLVERAQQAVALNLRRLVTEVKETGELAKLLGAASVRELSPAEAAKVKAQLLDICKTIPALAIFVLPGGGILLPILMKALPFSLLPTAFNEDDVSA